MNIINPFIISGYVAPPYFCDREKETEEVTSAMYNRRNLVIVSPRRMGKTGLIQHCFAQENISSDCYTFFIDIYAANSLKEFVYILGKCIFNVLKPKGKRFVENFFSTITSLRAAFKIDSLNGQPVFDIGLGDIRQPEVSLEEIFRYLEAADKPCLVAIDEFQQISRFPEKNTEALLRTHIQKCGNTVFIFAGSQQHMMQNIFFSASRPFYQSASFLNLSPIPEDVYVRFVQHHFGQNNKAVSEQCIRTLYSFFEGHTWYLQMVFNRLFEYTAENSEADIAEAYNLLDKIVCQNEVVYQNILAMLPERQKEVLIAVAKERTATAVTSSGFIRRHALASPSSVQSAIKQLLDKDLITKNNDTYQVYDRFFAIHLLNHYGNGFDIWQP